MPGPLEKQAVAADFRMALRLCHGRGIRTLASCLCVSKRRDHPTNVPKVCVHAAIFPNFGDGLQRSV